MSKLLKHLGIKGQHYEIADDFARETLTKKQDTLTAGDNITISDSNVISANQIDDNSVSETKTWSSSKINQKVSSVYKVKGSVDTYDDLPEDAEDGDVYDVLDTDMNYVAIHQEDGSLKWDPLGTTVDLSEYVTKVNPVMSGSLRFNSPSDDDEYTLGENSIAAGSGTKVKANSSYAFGSDNTVDGVDENPSKSVFIFGDSNNTLTPSENMVIEGKSNIANGTLGHIEGSNNTMIAGTNVHIEGDHNTSDASDYVHIDGLYNSLQGGNRLVNLSGSYHNIGNGNSYIYASGSSNTILSGGNSHIYLEGSGLSVTGGGNHCVNVSGELNAIEAGNDNITVRGISNHISNANSKLTVDGEGSLIMNSTVESSVSGFKHYLGSGTTNVYIQGRCNSVNGGSSEVYIRGEKNYVGHLEKEYPSDSDYPVAANWAPAKRLFIEGSYNNFSATNTDYSWDNHIMGYANTITGVSAEASLVSGYYNSITTTSSDYYAYSMGMHILGANDTLMAWRSYGDVITGYSNNIRTAVSYGSLVGGRENHYDGHCNTISSDRCDSYGLTILGFQNRVDSGLMDSFGDTVTGASNHFEAGVIVDENNVKKLTGKISTHAMHIGGYNNYITFYGQSASIYQANFDGYWHILNFYSSNNRLNLNSFDISGYGSRVNWSNSSANAVHIEGYSHYITVGNVGTNGLHIEGYNNTCFVTTDEKIVEEAEINDYKFDGATNLTGVHIDGYCNTVLHSDGGTFVEGAYNKLDCYTGAFATHLGGYQNTFDAPKSNFISSSTLFGMGNKCEDANYSHFICGQYGIIATGSDALFVVGNGGSSSSPSNAFVVKYNGNAELKGKLFEKGDSTQSFRLTDEVTTQEFTLENLDYGTLFTMDILTQSNDCDIVYSAKFLKKSSTFKHIFTYYENGNEVEISLLDDTFTLEKKVSGTVDYEIKINVL